MLNTVPWLALLSLEFGSKKSPNIKSPLGGAWGLWAPPVCGSSLMCPWCVNQKILWKYNMILLPTFHW